MEDIKTVFLAIIGNLITPLLLTLGGIALSYYSSYSFEIKLIIFNTALILSAIILILSNRYAHRRVRLVHIKGHPHQYTIENNTYRHIPDPETLDYLGKLFGFDWKDSEEISDYKFKKFSSGSTLPSIRPHCIAFYQRIKLQEEQNQSS